MTGLGRHRRCHNRLGGSAVDLFTIPVMICMGYAMERGLIKHFYKRPHADQIL